MARHLNQRINKAATPPSVRSGRLMPKRVLEERAGTGSILPPLRGLGLAGAREILFNSPSGGIEPESVNGLGMRSKVFPLAN